MVIATNRDMSCDKEWFFFTSCKEFRQDLMHRPPRKTQNSETQRHALSLTKKERTGDDWGTHILRIDCL